MSATSTADAIARQHTQKAIDTIVQVLEDGFAEDKDRLKAADMILDRGHGKPNQAIIAIPGSNRQIAALLAGKTDEELMAIMNAHQLPRLAPIDAEYAEVVPAGTKPTAPTQDEIDNDPLLR